MHRAAGGQRTIARMNASPASANSRADRTLSTPSQASGQSGAAVTRAPEGWVADGPRTSSFGNVLTGPGKFALRTGLWVPRRREEVFPFFADAANLNTLTPPMLDFRIVTPGPIEMRAGARLEYRISLRGLPLRWKTNIAAWEPPYQFVDEQLSGPYRTWIHRHTFEPMVVNGVEGTMCRDVVEYDYLFAWLTHSWWVQRDLRQIFAYRREQMVRIFGGDGSVGEGVSFGVPRRG